MRFVDVTLAAPFDLRDFYGDTLGLPVEKDAIAVGETQLRFRVEDGGAFYHFALLVPGDRFPAALGWARERVELLGDVFDFDFWNAHAFYFHDPAGNIVELIAHHGLDENGRGERFAAEELVGLSELGLVGDRQDLLRDLEGIGLELWDGTVDEPAGLGFVGERGRTFILAAAGRGWLPTGRPGELHPVEAVFEAPRGRVELTRDGFEATRRA
jgi:hypothetical protein